MEVPFFYERTNQNARRTGLYYSPFPILPSTTDADGQHTRRYADGASKAGHCRPHSRSPSAHGSLSSSPARSFSDLPPHLLSCLPLSSRIYWPGASVILATQRGYAQDAYPLWETPVGPSGMYMRRLRLRKQNNKQQNDPMLALFPMNPQTFCPLDTLGSPNGSHKVRGTPGTSPVSVFDLP